MKKECSRHTLPSLENFKNLSDPNRRLAYTCGFKSLHKKRAPRPKSRRKLLESYIKIAGWDKESISTMQSAAKTPIDQK